MTSCTRHPNHSSMAPFRVYQVVLALILLTALCVVVCNEDTHVWTAERLALLKRVQRNLVQLPRSALWSILATQQRKLRDARQDIETQLRSVGDIGVLYDTVVSAEEKILAYRILCGVETTVGANDLDLVRRHYKTTIDLETKPEDIDACKDVNATLNTLLSEWRGLVASLRAAEGNVLRERPHLQILQRAYERSVAYHEHIRDLVFLEDEADKLTALERLHQTPRYTALDTADNLRRDDALKDAMVTSGDYVHVDAIALQRDLCSDVTGAGDSGVAVPLCPPEIVSQIVALRDAEWMYYRIRNIVRLNILSKTELAAIAEHIQAEIDMLRVQPGVREPPPDLPVFLSLNPVSARVPPEFFRDDSDGGLPSSGGAQVPSTPDPLMNLMILHQDIIGVKSFRYKVVDENYYVFYSLEFSLKERVVELQTALGLLYGETLLDPTSTVRVYQDTLRALYNLLRLRIFFESPSDFLSPVEHSSASGTKHLSKRALKFFLNGTLSSFFDLNIIDLIQYEATTQAVSVKKLEGESLQSAMYTAKIRFNKCMDLQGNKHRVASKHHAHRWVSGGDALSMEIHCLELAQEVIDTESMMQETLWGDLLVHSTEGKLNEKLRIRMNGTLMKEEHHKHLFFNELFHILRIIRSLDQKSLDAGDLERHVLRQWIQMRNTRLQEIWSVLLKNDEKHPHLFLEPSPSPATDATTDKPSSIKQLQRILRTHRNSMYRAHHEGSTLRGGQRRVVQQYVRDRWDQRRAMSTLLDSPNFPSDECGRYQKNADFARHVVQYREQLSAALWEDNTVHDAERQPEQEASLSSLETRHPVPDFNSFATAMSLMNTAEHYRDHPHLAHQVATYIINLNCEKFASHNLECKDSYYLFEALHAHDVMHIESVFLEVWEGVSARLLPQSTTSVVSEPMMDAVAMVCERHATALDAASLDDAVEKCPPEVLTELRDLYLLEYKRHRSQFVVDFKQLLTYRPELAEEAEYMKLLLHASGHTDAPAFDAARDVILTKVKPHHERLATLRQDIHSARTSPAASGTGKAVSDLVAEHLAGIRSQSDVDALIDVSLTNGYAVGADRALIDVAILSHDIETLLTNQDATEDAFYRHHLQVSIELTHEVERVRWQLGLVHYPLLNAEVPSRRLQVQVHEWLHHERIVKQVSEVHDAWNINPYGDVHLLISSRIKRARDRACDSLSSDVFEGFGLDFSRTRKTLPFPDRSDTLFPTNIPINKLQHLPAASEAAYHLLVACLEKSSTRSQCRKAFENAYQLRTWLLDLSHYFPMIVMERYDVETALDTVHELENGFEEERSIEMHIPHPVRLSEGLPQPDCGETCAISLGAYTRYSRNKYKRTLANEIRSIRASIGHLDLATWYAEQEMYHRDFLRQHDSLFIDATSRESGTVKVDVPPSVGAKEGDATDPTNRASGDAGAVGQRPGASTRGAGPVPPKESPDAATTERVLRAVEADEAHLRRAFAERRRGVSASDDQHSMPLLRFRLGPSDDVASSHIERPPQAPRVSHKVVVALAVLCCVALLALVSAVGLWRRMRAFHVRTREHTVTNVFDSDDVRTYNYCE